MGVFSYVTRDMRKSVKEGIKGNSRRFFVGGRVVGMGAHEMHLECLPHVVAGSEILYHLRSCHTVDGRNPAPPGMHKTLQIM